MTLTKEVLKRIIKEELDKLVQEEEEVVEAIDPADAQIAKLEHQLAEAKKAKLKGGSKGGSAAKMGLGVKSKPESHKLKPFTKKK